MTKEYKSEKILSAGSDNNYAHSPFTEKTAKLSSLYPDSYISPWNPDDLVQKNQEYEIYEDMLKDDQVSVCLNLKKDLVLCNGFDFIPQDNDQEDMVEDLKKAIKEDPDWPFEEMLEEILSAFEFGFSISEKIFKKREDGKISLKHIKTRHPGPWLLHQDEAGNVTRYEQQGTSNSANVPEHVLMHYVNNRKFQNPYGTSDLRAAYQAYFAKKHITRWYSIFIEKSASPIPHGKYDSAASPKAVDDMYNALKKFQTKSVLVTPDYMEVDLIESKSNGEAFIKGINIFNMFIGRSLLIPDLLGFQGSETSGGSFSLGENQMNVFFKHIKRRREILEKMINNHIVWPIIVHNFGLIENYPRFKLRPISNEELVSSAKLWLEAVKSHVYRPTEEEIKHFKGIVDFPITDGDPLAEDDDALEDPNVEIIPTDDSDEAPMDDEEEVSNIELKKKYRFGPTNGEFSEKTNFQLIENQLNTAKDTFQVITESNIDQIFTDLVNQIDKKRIVQSGRIDKAEKINLNTKKLQKTIFNSLKKLYEESKITAQSEVIKSGFAKPVVDEAFLKFLEEETFQFIGDWEYAVTKGARVAMVEAIKDGKSLASVIDVIDDKTKAKAINTMNTFARTKFTEVMNKGRVKAFEDTGVVAGYQYSAILDDRVTEICRGLHGKKFFSGNQPIPPMHFNCRSVLIPITKFEAFKPDAKVGKKPIEAFIEEKKGSGFPKQ